MKKLLVIAILVFALFGIACSSDSRLYPVTDLENGNLGYKFIDKDAKTAIDESYEDVILNFDSENAKDYAIVIDDGKIQIINKKGESLVDTEFQNVAEIFGDRAILVNNGRNILYDLKNKKEVLTHDYIKSESNGIFAFMEGGKWGYRDEKKIIVEPSYDEAYSFGKNFAVATKEGAAYKIGKDGVGSSLPFSEVVKASESNYLLGVNNGKVSLLNLDGDIIFENIEGDVVEVNHDMLVIMKRNDGKIKQAIYSVNGEEIAPAIYDDVRLLSKKYYSAKENADPNFALYNINGTKLTDNKYSYLNADYFDENGGIITAITNNLPKYLDKAGVEVKGPTLEDVVDVIKDKNFYILKTNDLVYYYGKDPSPYTSPVPNKIGSISYVINKDTNSPMLFNEKLREDVNENLKNIVNEITSNKRNYKLNLRGDILDVNMKFGMDEVRFMYDISRAAKVQLEDIFNDDNIEEKILKLAGENENSKIIGFVLDDNLKITIKNGDRISNKIVDYEKIEPLINKDGGTFFKSVLAPSINVEHK